MRREATAPSPVTLGVDIMEVARARRFYNHHKDRLSRFFSATEINYISRDPHARMASMVASKEAVFKALGQTQGMMEFTKVRIRPVSKNLFQFHLTKQLIWVMKLILSWMIL